MRFILACCLFVWLGGFAATSQVLPKSDGSCTVSASGVYVCNWIGLVPDVKTDRNDATETAGGEGTQLFVTRLVLSRGAPLKRLVEGHDVLIVGRNDGELVNDLKPPPAHVYLANGFAMLMPKEEPFLLRNVGNQDLDLLLVEIRKVASLRIAPLLCPDPNQREAKIGGNSITGYVLLHKRPLRGALVWLYAVDLLTWIGFTDENGEFATGKLPPGVYRLDVAEWGSTRVQLDPNLDKGHGGQTPAWSLLLIDSGCVGTTMNMD
jgi:hypothetical protein